MNLSRQSSLAKGRINSNNTTPRDTPRSSHDTQHELPAPTPAPPVVVVESTQEKVVPPASTDAPLPAAPPLPTTPKFRRWTKPTVPAVTTAKRGPPAPLVALPQSPPPTERSSESSLPQPQDCAIEVVDSTENADVDVPDENAHTKEHIDEEDDDPELVIHVRHSENQSEPDHGKTPYTSAPVDSIALLDLSPVTNLIF